MKKVLWNPTTLMGPLPSVMVSCGSIEKPNVLAVAWTGIVNTKPAMTYISLQPSRESYRIIDVTEEFVINLVPVKLVKALDYCGVKSGREVDKFSACLLTPETMEYVSAPGIMESPISLECRVKQKIPLGSHVMFLSEILAVHVSRDLIDNENALHFEKADILSYAHGRYYELGKEIGKFGFSVKKRKKTGKKSFKHKKK